MFDTFHTSTVDEFTVTDKGVFSLTNPPDKYLDKAIETAIKLRDSSINSAQEAKQAAKVTRKSQRYAVCVPNQDSEEKALLAAQAAGMKILQKRHTQNHLEKWQECKQNANHYQQVIDSLQARKKTLCV